MENPNAWSTISRPKWSPSHQPIAFAAKAEPLAWLAGQNSFKPPRSCAGSRKNPLILILAEGRSAVVACDFEIDFKAGDHVVQMSGRDLMTLDKRNGRWWLVADHFSPTPA